MFSDAVAPTAKGIHVPAGADRHRPSPPPIWGRIPMAVKVSAKDTDGGLFVFQHTDMAKGGPPRHIHHGQDEWFFVIKGEFAIEVGDDAFRMRPGDSFLAPRGVPHAWACVSDEPGTMLTALTPAGTFETFILETTRHDDLPSPDEMARAFEAHGMTVVGPPLEVR